MPHSASAAPAAMACDQLLMGPPDVLWPFELRQNPDVAWAAPKYDTFRLPLRGDVELSCLSREDIRKIAYNDRIALAFVRQHPWDYIDEVTTAEGLEKLRDKVQRMARLMYTRLTVDLKPEGSAFSQEDFAKLVRLSGLKLETQSEVFRYDQRSPDEIARAGGFFPNPSKKEKAYTLIEHSLRFFAGGFFVSTTLQEGNEKILPSSALFEDKPITGREAVKLLTDLGVDPKEVFGVLAVRKAFEYRISDLKGARIEAYGIDSEKEFVTNAIPRWQIEAFREVTLIEYVDSVRADIFKMPASMGFEERKEMLWRMSAAHVGTLKKTSFGEWQPFP